ncbi:MAG: hypothetical protein JWM25_1085 [Thermoleophilia bacterium]|nr:hypothetical protein [Thermoleophilia bacterium]MCZ4496502.1 hypothetical protein [Thermoleophilia bacterium]
MSTPNPGPTELHFAVSGMHCGGCSNAVSRRLGKLDSVDSVEVSLDDKLVRVLGTALVAQELRAAITEAGYEARLLA